MLSFILHITVTAVLLAMVAKMVSGIDVEGLGSALAAALVLGLVNAFVRPVVVFLSLPLTLLTLGLFLLVINALMLWLTSAVVPGFRVKGLGPAVLGSLLFSVFNWMVDKLVY
jgi:putative membrane protein